MSEADLRALFGVRRVECPVLLDQSLYNEHDRINGDLQVLLARSTPEDGSLTDGADVAELGEQLAALEDRMIEATSIFAFQAIGSKAWLALAAEHPPTSEERIGGKDVHDETFRPAALAATCVEARDIPERFCTHFGLPVGEPITTIPLEMAEAMFAMLRTEDVSRLWTAIYEVGVGGGGLPKSPLAFVARRLNGASRSTASNTASRDRSSSDESSDPGSLTG